MTTPLRLFNSLTRQIEDFKPVREGEARVYSCGPTVYNYPHIGNMRAYVFADVLGRTLSFKGYQLTHVINITDVGHLTDDADAGEDKLEKAAAEQVQRGLATSIWKIARYYTEAFWDDVKDLNIRGPMSEGTPSKTNWTIATDYIEQMIDFAKGIADKHCYELESGLYFDVSTVADYGRLARSTEWLDAAEFARKAAIEAAGQQAASIAANATEEAFGRIEHVRGKRNAADFAIWRKTPAGETRQMEWNSPWGRGAPGWHLECSVMSGAVLGFPFDIHTGGIDHREIHHPNEIAQNQAYGCTNGLDVAANSGANVWMHNNFLVERSGKMSKSSGEFLRLQLLVDRGYHPLAYRLMCLQAHYRSELEFSWEGLQAALTRLKRMVLAIEREKAKRADDDLRKFDLPEVVWTYDKVQMMIASFQPFALDKNNDPDPDNIAYEFDMYLASDLNTALALTSLDEALEVMGLASNDKLALISALDSVLGLNLLNLARTDLRIRPKSATITEAEIEARLAQRKEARAAKDFTTSDALRDELAAHGVEVMDGDPLGWDWKLGQ